MFGGARDWCDERLSFFAHRAVQGLEPVIEIGEPVRGFGQITMGDIVVTRRGHAEGRSQERGAFGRRGMVGVQDRPVFFPILGDASVAVDDVAGDHEEVRFGQVSSIGDRLFFGGPCTAIAEDNEPLRLVGQLGGAGIGRKDDLVFQSDPVTKHFTGLEAGQGDMIDPVRFDARHGDTPRDGELAACQRVPVPGWYSRAQWASTSAACHASTSFPGAGA